MRKLLSIFAVPGMVGAGFLMTIVTLSLVFVVDPSRRLGTLFLVLREVAIELPMFAVVGWGIGAAVRLSRLTEERARPDLLDPRPAVYHRGGVPFLDPGGGPRRAEPTMLLRTEGHRPQTALGQLLFQHPVAVVAQVATDTVQLG